MYLKKNKKYVKIDYTSIIPISTKYFKTIL